MLLCKFCDREYKSENSHHQHEIRCKQNENRIIPYSTSAYWTDERKNNWSKHCIEFGSNQVIWTEDRRIKYSKQSKEINKNYWTDEKRLDHSEKMKKVVAKNPDSYSKNNVSGRVKMYEVLSSIGKTQVKGKWELTVAQYLNKNNILWTNKIEPYKYFWNNKWHLYFPDFYLVSTDILIEVKGYETDRDFAKWKAVKDKKLIVLKEKEIKEIIQGSVGMAFTLIRSIE